MTLASYVRQQRKAIDAYVRAKVPNCPKLDDADRAEWIQNDETLYLWAQSKGVQL